MAVIDIDRIIQTCFELQRYDVPMLEETLQAVSAVAREVFLSESMLLEIDGPLNICGDVHGQYQDLLRIFGCGGMPSEANKYLFLGDYVDRGKQSLETIVLLFALKVRFPRSFFLLRGNHECASINRIYGFYDECKRRYGVKLWMHFCDAFNCMPVTALVGERILCMHGGLSPDLVSLEQIRALERPTEIPQSGLLCDLLWADPDEDTQYWAFNCERGISCTFGADAVARFLEEQDLDLVCRAHQVVEDGYEFFFGRRLVTLFSAPNYLGEFDNVGAMMTLNEDLMCSMVQLKPAACAEEEQFARAFKL